MRSPAARLGLVCVALLSLGLAAAESLRPMPFNRENVYSYFKRVEELKRELPASLVGPAYEEELCRLHVLALTSAGYDFNSTVVEALDKINDLNKNMDNPRYSFLAGAFPVHPDVYLRQKYITKNVRDAVVALFTPEPSP